ncbi:MAG: M20/M25/M40 family metallo-hydrolase [Candidatus Gracilibacteria bacterium]
MAATIENLSPVDAFTSGVYPDVESGGETAKFIGEISNPAWVDGGDNLGRHALVYTEPEDRTFEAIKNIGETLAEEARAKGMEVTVEEDFAGNVYITLIGEDPDAKKILIESHGDSVPRGGRVDGVYGIASGLTLVKKFIDEGRRPAKSLIVAAFRGEESSRTKFGCLGSALATGSVTIERLKKIKNESSGKSIFHELRERFCHKNGQILSDDQFEVILQKELGMRADFLRKIAYAIEVHPEQADILQTLDKSMAAVTAIGAAERYDLIFSGDIFEQFSPEMYVSAEGPVERVKLKIIGQADHSGAAPMNGEKFGDKTYFRRDALVETARIFAEIMAQPVEGLAVTGISVPGGGVNTVSGVCELEIVLPRSIREKVLRDIENKMNGWVGLKAEIVEENIQRNLQGIRDEVLRKVFNLIVTVNYQATDFAVRSGGKVRATMGNIQVKEDKIIVSVDQRKTNEDWHSQLRPALHRVFEEFHSQGVNLTETEPNCGEIANCNEAMIGFADKVYKVLYGEKMENRDSMPGHDLAKFILKGVPSILFFVRSYNGSHNPNEAVRVDDVREMDKFLEAFVEELMSAA